jgi:Rieske 2Fe-2S family protein
MDVTSAYRLGRDAYLDDDWFRREQEQVIGRAWTFVAWTDELQAPGDYVAATIGDAPVVVVLDDDGELRAFHNLCRHRGMVMLDGTGNTSGGVSCPYHFWKFGLDGALRFVPQRKEQFPDLDPTCWGLLPASVDVWNGMVFVHPDPDAMPLAEHVEMVAHATGTFRAEALELAGRHLIDAHCNWKLFVENHIDVYHLWYLHEQTLGDLDHTKFQHETRDGHWVSYEPWRKDIADTRLTARTAIISHLDDHDRNGVGAHLLYPNQMFATTAEYFATYRAIPVAPDRCVIDLRVRAEPGVDADAIMKSVRSFIDEDVFACEAVQAGIRSPYFSVGPLARAHEHPITLFHDHLLATLDR